MDEINAKHIKCTNVHGVCIRVNEFQYTNNELSSCIPSEDNVFASDLQCVCQFMLRSCANKMKEILRDFARKTNQYLVYTGYPQKKEKSVPFVVLTMCFALYTECKELVKRFVAKEQKKNIQIHRKNVSFNSLPMQHCYCHSLEHNGLRVQTE